MKLLHISLGALTTIPADDDNASYQYGDKIITYN